MKINLVLYCAIFLLLSACTKDKILNPLEKRLPGRWIEATPSYTSERFHFLTDRSFEDPLTGRFVKGYNWHAKDNKLYLTYRISLLGWLSFALQKKPTQLNIKKLTDSTAILEKPATEIDPASLISLKKAKHNGKYITE